MYLLQAPSSINTTISLPSSKSISNRALILDALSGHHIKLEKIADCDDSRVLLQALKNTDALKDIGAAGTAMRFLTAYYAMTEGEWILTGSERMKNRPIRLLVEALRQMGASIDYLEKEGFPPLKIRGKRLSGGDISLDGSISSQYLSALMMIAPCTEKGIAIHIENKINSRPYLEMTQKMMQSFGVCVQWQGNDISIAPQSYKAPTVYSVEADWSAASYWFEIAALSDANLPSQITLQGLSSQSLQGDSRVKVWFEQLGVKAVFRQNDLVLTSVPVACTSFEADFSQQPDLAQTFAVTCALKNIPMELRGLESLKIKETDRMQALIQEMRRLGYVLHEQNNSLIWRGERCEASPRIVVETYEDHRMAMAFAPAVILLSKCRDVQSFGVAHPEVVAKSYKNYWDDLASCGFQIIPTEPK